MMDHQILFLLIAIGCIILAHGATTIKKKDTEPEKAIRQGLEISLESHEEFHEPKPLVHGEQKIEFDMYNDPNLHNDEETYHGSNIEHREYTEKEFEEDNEDALILGVESREVNSNELIMPQSKATRSLEAGDIFTAQDMLPIAEKLMSRAKSNGKGKGIVTSETNPKSLADNLFEKFFWKNCEIHLLNGETVVSHADDWCNLVETTDEKKVFKIKRIVVLKDEDICGLDALQALSLSGTVDTLRSKEKYIGTGTDLKENSDKAFPDSTEIAPRRKSLYKLLNKPFYDKIRKVPRRRGKYQTTDGRKARMGKKRKLIINPKRRLAKKIKNLNRRGGQHKGKKLNKIGRHGLKQSKIMEKTSNKTDGSKTKRFCRWKYGCEHQLVLETCRLFMDCSEDAKSKNYLGIKLLPNEKRENLAMLRNWAGVDVIDSEVEKILENRYNQQIYSKLGNIQRSESIAEYFNNLINFQKREDNNGVGPTTPMYSYEDDLDAKGARYEQSSGELDAEEIEPSQEVVQESEESGIVADVAESGTAEVAEPGTAEVAEPGTAEAETAAEEGTIESEHVQEEVDATELSDTENRRKLLRNHKTTMGKLKKS